MTALTYAAVAANPRGNDTPCREAIVASHPSKLIRPPIAPPKKPRGGKKGKKS